MQKIGQQSQIGKGGGKELVVSRWSSELMVSHSLPGLDELEAIRLMLCLLANEIIYLDLICLLLLHNKLKLKLK